MSPRWNEHPYDEKRRLEREADERVARGGAREPPAQWPRARRAEDFDD